ncbi:hypothetical protein ABTZ98_28730 [Streptomyces bacillaris]
MTQAVVEVGARLRYDERVWTVAVLEGARATLVTDEGTSAVVLLPYLFAHPSFDVEGGPTPGRVPPFGLLEALPDQVRRSSRRSTRTGTARGHWTGNATTASWRT